VIRRVTRLSCLAAAGGLAVAGVATAPSAGAIDLPSYTYSSVVTAVGLQTALFSNPEPSSVPDLTDVETPASNAQLDSFGTSEAAGHVGTLNGLGQLPSLICLASAAFCRAIPIGQLTAGTINSFPPPDPLQAHATYPAHQDDSAPSIGAKKAQVEVHNGPFQLGQGVASAHADASTTHTSAVDSSVTVVKGLSIGSIRTTTNQSVTTNALHTDALAEVSNINIGVGHLLHIGSARSALSIDSRPGKPAIDHATSQVGNVTVLGKPATIDSKGVHVKTGPGVPKAVAAAYQKTLDAFFKAAGFGLREAKIHRSNASTGHTVTVGGLVLFFDHTVKGAPPLTVGLPSGVPCPIATISSKLPVDPCAGIGLSFNAKYRGQIALGQVGAVSLAAPADTFPQQPTPDPTKATTGGGGKGGNSGSGSSSGGSGSIPPVTNPGGGLGGGPTVTGPTDNGQPPALAGNSTSVFDPLKGLSGRIWWFFPLIALSVLALVGRLRTPARLPSQ
jgi:hypothetical protein